MEQQTELQNQNRRLDRIEKALDSLHHVSKTVGDELEEQITLIERLEEETDRAQESTRKLHKNIKTKALSRQRADNRLLNIVIVLIVVFIVILILYILSK
ncbi:hypothetical protein WA171_006661 [Blastocystis sp. BT1]